MIEKIYCLGLNEKKRFLWTMTAVQAAENHGDELGLTWYLRWGMYASISTWTHLLSSLVAAEAPT